MESPPTQSELVDAEHDSDYGTMPEVSIPPNSKLLNGLLFLDDYRVTENASPPHFELHGHFIDGQCYWVREADLHRAWGDALLITFWVSREDPGGRPDQPVPEELLRVYPTLTKDKSTKRNTYLRVQMVGTPLFSPRLEKYLHNEKEKFGGVFAHKASYMMRKELERRWPGCLNDSARMTDSIPREDDLVMIFSHRKNETRKIPCFQFFCFYRQRKGNWVDEAKIQEQNSAAVVTYWNSTKGIREKESKGEPCVPDQYLKILGHRVSQGKTLLTVQLVGKSQSIADVEELEAHELIKLWKRETTKYLRQVKLRV
ncbi:hypothetical protein ACHAPK_011449 [Fusarium culmorum]